MESRKKNEIFYLILLVLTIITMCIGITFTYFSIIAREKKDSTQIRTGVLEINYIDGRVIDTYALLPIYEPNINSTYSVYKKKFAVRSTGTLDQTLDINIDVTNNEFTSNELKFAIYDSNNNKIGTGSIPYSGSVRIASGIYLKAKEEKTFTVLIWLGENGENQDIEQGKTFVGGFDITANQIKYE